MSDGSKNYQVINKTSSAPGKSNCWSMLFTGGQQWALIQTIQLQPIWGQQQGGTHLKVIDKQYKRKEIKEHKA